MSGLKLKIDICPNNSCLWFKFKETTGDYDSITNVNGWNSPNPDISLYEPGVNSDASLLVQLPNGTIVPIDISDYFPTIDNTFSIDITTNDLGINSFPFGIYTITYSLTVDGSNYSVTSKVLIDCEIKCKLEKMLSKVSLTKCYSCEEDDTLDKIMYIKTLLCVAKSALSCGNEQRAQEAIDLINSLFKGIKDCNC
jgi:hypothetical protein